MALARLLTPAEVGIFTAGTVLTTALFDFVEGGLRAALVQRGGRIDDAAETVFRATLLSGAVLCVGVLAIAPVVSMVFDDQTVGLVAAATSGTLLLFALTNVPEAMLQRDFNVRRRIIVGPAVSLTFATVAVTLAACGWGVWSMVVGSYASTLVWVVGVWWISGWRPGRGRFDFTLWRELAKFGSPLVASQVGFRVKGIAEAVIVGRSSAPPNSASTAMPSASPRSRNGSSSTSARWRCSPRSRGSPTTPPACDRATCAHCSGP